MKAFVFALLLVAVGANALPKQYDDDFNRQSRIVTNQIRRAIEDLSRQMVEAGLDPIYIDRFEYSASPVPIVVTVNAFVEKVTFKGISNILIHSLDYSALTNRLRIDISLPEISLVVGDSGVNASIFGSRYTGSFSGSIAVTSIRVFANIRVNIGIISGVSLRSVEATFRVGNVQSGGSLIFNGNDYSDEFNTVFNDTIPQLLLTHQQDIDEFLSDLILRVGNEALGRSLLAENGVIVA